MDQFTGAILRGAALPTVVVGLAIALGVWIFIGAHAAVGALLGTLVVAIFFTAGQLILGAVLRHNPAMALSVAMVLYLAKIGVLLVLLLLLADTTVFDTKVFALTVLVCTLVWTGAEVWVFSRTKALTVDPDGVPPAVAQHAEFERKAGGRA